MGKTENIRLENAIKEHLSKLLANQHELRMIKDSTEEIALAAKQVSNTADMLNSNAMDQAALVEETGTALGEMIKLIESNAKAAIETDKIANHAMQTTDVEAQGILRAVNTMQVIAEKVQVIQEIAAQTNLLALNATIEAARAGEHGRSFAVVASEIGKLAGTSTKAAKRIQDLVNESSSIAKSAAEALKRIIASIQETARKVMVIRNASTEQSEASKQISESIARLNQIAEQTASAAEELAATAEEMNSQTSALMENLIAFQSANSTSKDSETKMAPTVPAKTL